MQPGTTPPAVRIGELARRTGVSPDLIRAWERRYGLLQPRRTSGGFRLFTGEDEARLRRMLGHIESGMAASEAARLAVAGFDPGPADASERQAGRSEVDVGSLTESLAEALSRFDEGGANAALDRMFAAYGLDTVLGQVLLPFLRRLGERWSRGEASVGEEHFASNLLMSRLLALARGWGQGTGPQVVLACAPGEQHELALVMFGLVLRAQGWRVVYLGADTPADTLRAAVDDLAPSLTVVAATVDERFLASAAEFRSLAQSGPVAIAGPGATPEAGQRLGVSVIGSDPVTAALEDSMELARLDS